MASLLDLTVQGDVATISDESKLPQVKLMTPLELYRLWERQNWASHEIDLDPGPPRLGGDERGRARGDAVGPVGVLRRARSASPTSSRAWCWRLRTSTRRRSCSPSRSTRRVTPSTSTGSTRRCSTSTAGSRIGSSRPAAYLTDRLLQAVRRLPRRGSPQAPGRPHQRRGEARLHHHLPHGDRGHARAHRPALPDDAPGAAGHPARPPGGVQADLPGRAPPRRLRHVVPPAARRATRSSPSACRTSCARRCPRRPG